MKAAIYVGPKNIVTSEVDKPEIGEKDILMRVKSCGICGSDLHMYAEGIFAEVLCRSTPQGGIPGHEFSGEIVEVGSKVKDLAVGDRVAGMGNGGMAEFAPISPARSNLNVYKLPDEVSYAEAATLEPLANSLHAVNLGKPKKGETVVVFGAGIIGLGVIQVLRALDPGLEKIIAVDVSDKRLETAIRFGADDVINAATDDLLVKAFEVAGTVDAVRPIPMPTPKIDLIFDCVGYIKARPEPAVIQQSLIISKVGGRIVVHGAFEEAVPIEFMFIVGKHLQIQGSYGCIPSEILEALDMMKTKKVERESIISHTFPLDQADEAFQLQLSVKESVKVFINP